MSTGDPLVLFLLGPERWLQAEAVEGLRRRVLSAGFEETDFVRFNTGSAEPLQILEAARTAPFGSTRRVVLVEGLEELDPEELPWLVQYLGDPCRTTCLILCALRFGGGKDWLPDSLQRSGQVQLIGCLPLKDRELQDWVTQRARREGKSLEPDAADLLIQRVGTELQALALALEGLTLLAGDVDRITRAEVERLFSPSLRETAFEILDAAAAGQGARALSALHEALATGRLAMDPFLGALGWYYRKGPMVRMRRWTTGQMRRALEDLLRADVRIKQGHPDPEWLAGQLLLNLRRSS